MGSHGWPALRFSAMVLVVGLPAWVGHRLKVSSKICAAVELVDGPNDDDIGSNSPVGASQGELGNIGGATREGDGQVDIVGSDVGRAPPTVSRDEVPSYISSIVSWFGKSMIQVLYMYWSHLSAHRDLSAWFYLPFYMPCDSSFAMIQQRLSKPSKSLEGRRFPTMAALEGVKVCPR